MATIATAPNLNEHRVTDRRDFPTPNRRLAAIAAALAVALLVCALSARAADSAVAFMYHRFGESELPSTNIRIEQFEQHLEELRSGPYTVMPLPEIVRRLGNREALPDRAVAITIDDAYLSVYEQAWPRLRRAGLPFTLFVATEPIDAAASGYMSWDQIRELKAAGVTIGSQTASHPHMPLQDPDSNRAELALSNERFEAELGERPSLLAYPYGEASASVMELAKEMGFDAAFGQHSGVIHNGESLYYLPRFALNEQFGDLERFRLGANALPLPVTDVTPADPLLQTATPAFGFTVADGIDDLAGLACYSSGQGRARLERLGERRIEVRLDT
ncbi:MAG: polysaccharide deacetylase family protein, partial [Acetobacterales bacterium]